MAQTVSLVAAMPSVFDSPSATARESEKLPSPTISTRWPRMKQPTLPRLPAVVLRTADAADAPLAVDESRMGANLGMGGRRGSEGGGGSVRKPRRVPFLVLGPGCPSFPRLPPELPRFLFADEPGPSLIVCCGSTRSGSAEQAPSARINFTRTKGLNSDLVAVAEQYLVVLSQCVPACAALWPL